jgi:hypothetical protein
VPPALPLGAFWVVGREAADAAVSAMNSACR